MIVVNPGGAERASIMENSTARWQTLYGSISFNQMGPGMPTSGMNTAGLVVSLMWNDAVVFPPVEGTEIVNELELIQLVLDSSSTVTEALEIFSQISVQPLVPIQYFVSDISGDTAAVMPTADGMVVHHGDTMPVRALTNSSYPTLMDDLADHVGFGGPTPLPPRSPGQDPDSTQRFIAAAHAAASQDPKTAQDAFEALVSVENSETRWQIVFDPHAQAINFTLADQTGHWRIDMADVDFSCAQGLIWKDLGTLVTGKRGVTFYSLGIDHLGGLLSDVLNAFSDTLGLPPDIAMPMAHAQMNALSCGD